MVLECRISNDWQSAIMIQLHDVRTSLANIQIFYAFTSHFILHVHVLLRVHVIHAIRVNLYFRGIYIRTSALHGPRRDTKVYRLEK